MPLWNVMLLNSAPCAEAWPTICRGHQSRRALVAPHSFVCMGGEGGRQEKGNNKRGRCITKRQRRRHARPEWGVGLS